jgi:hypothetical protein
MVRHMNGWRLPELPGHASLWLGDPHIFNTGSWCSTCRKPVLHPNESALTDTHHPLSPSTPRHAPACPRRGNADLIAFSLSTMSPLHGLQPVHGPCVTRQLCVWRRLQRYMCGGGVCRLAVQCSSFPVSCPRHYGGAGRPVPGERHHSRRLPVSPLRSVPALLGIDLPKVWQW